MLRSVFQENGQHFCVVHRQEVPLQSLLECYLLQPLVVVVVVVAVAVAIAAVLVATPVVPVVVGVTVAAVDDAAPVVVGVPVAVVAVGPNVVAVVGVAVVEAPLHAAQKHSLVQVVGQCVLPKLQVCVNDLRLFLELFSVVLVGQHFSSFEHDFLHFLVLFAL